MQELYSDLPTTALFHYTSLEGLIGIVDSRTIHATDLHFFNDAAEMNRTASLLQTAAMRAARAEPFTLRLRQQLISWSRNRLTLGHSIFAACFTANGNLLSQWRSYCEQAKGVSIGFAPQELGAKAGAQGFRIGRCIYDATRQQLLAKKILQSVEDLARTMGENTDPAKRAPDNSFYDVFEAIEDDLLRIAALLKEPAFVEEQEWRAVSQIVTNYVTAPISYRVGISMLIPYIRLSLPSYPDRPLDLYQVFIGPTPNVNNSMVSVTQYHSKAGASPRVGVGYCGIPYRTW